MNDITNRFSIEKCDDPDEADALSALGGLTFTQSFGHMYKADDLNMFLRDSHAPAIYRRVLSDPSFGVWVVRNASREIVGFAIAGPCDLPVPDMPANAGELGRLYMLQDHQGLGLGQQLLGQVFPWLEENFDQLYVSVYALNHGAQRLYARYGFRKAHEYDYMVGTHADPEFIMMRPSLSSGISTDASSKLAPPTGGAN